MAVYLDFDNIVISRYDQVHGRNSFQKDKARGLDDDKLTTATVDLGAIIDFASSFGTLVLTRAYADWSADLNANYQGQLVGRAVDLVQLFPAAAYGKNGADIRLAVDAVEDMFRLPDLTHVVIVGGDSDYIALAQRCKRLGRYVVGIGVAGASSRSLASACDEFVTYDALPGIPTVAPAPAKKATKRTKSKEPDDEPEPADTQAAATGLLERALRIGHEKDDADWLHNSAVKAQMKRMDPSFSEKSLGFRSFSDFLRSRSDVADLDESSTTRMVRLHQRGSKPRSDPDVRASGEVPDRVSTYAEAMTERLYFRQLLSGRDFAQSDMIAQQMRNFSYLIGDRETGDTVVVDPAYAANDLVDILESDGMKLSGVLVTHHHPDHVGGSMMGFELKGLAELLERQSVPVHVNSLEAEWVSRVTGIARSDLTAHEHGDKVNVGDVEIELLHTPGHTPGSQCFLLDGRLVAGDTLFLEGCGRTDFPGGDVDDMFRSLQQLAAAVRRPDGVSRATGTRWSPARRCRTCGAPTTCTGRAIWISGEC